MWETIAVKTLPGVSPALPIPLSVMLVQAGHVCEPSRNSCFLRDNHSRTENFALFPFLSPSSMYTTIAYCLANTATLTHAATLSHTRLCTRDRDFNSQCVYVEWCICKFMIVRVRQSINSSVVPHMTSPVRTQQTLNIFLYFSVSHQFNHGKTSRRGLELHNLKLGPSVVIPVHDILYITATPFSLNSGFTWFVVGSCDCVFVSSSDGGKVAWILLHVDACTIVNSELSFI